MIMLREAGVEREYQSARLEKGEFERWRGRRSGMYWLTMAVAYLANV